MITRMNRLSSICVAASFLLGLTACGGPSGTEYVSIGTGSQTGVYFPTGANIAKLMSQSEEFNINATAQSTDGSVVNIDQVLVGALEFGIAQSDRQYQAYNGLAEWADRGPQRDLRSVFALHSEAVTLVANAESGIESIGDLRGKRVNIGSPNSGHRQNAIDAITDAGLDWSEDLDIEQVTAGEAPSLLQDGQIDAFFYTVGHPNNVILQATAGKVRVRIVPIPVSDSLLSENPFYARAVIPADMYEGAVNESDINTFGVKATMVTHASVSEDVVYAMTKSVLDNLDRFRGMHEASSGLTPQNMLEGLSAPIHEGAMRFYSEQGLK